MELACHGGESSGLVSGRKRARIAKEEGPSRLRERDVGVDQHLEVVLRRAPLDDEGVVDHFLEPSERLLRGVVSELGDWDEHGADVLGGRLDEATVLEGGAFHVFIPLANRRGSIVIECAALQGLRVRHLAVLVDVIVPEHQIDEVDLARTDWDLYGRVHASRRVGRVAVPGARRGRVLCGERAVVAA